MIARQLTVLLFFFLLAACAAPDSLSRQMADWQHEDVTSAIAAWGEPEDRLSMGDEVILIWRDRAYLPDATAGAPQQPVLCERQLAVAGDGTITGWRWRGNACPALASSTQNTAMFAQAQQSAEGR